MSIRIDPEFRRLIAPLSSDEYAQLEANLVAAHGARDSIVVWQGLLLDGHNRYEICKRLGLRYTVKPITLADRVAARIWIRWNQLGRRNLTDDQRAMNVSALMRDLAVQSKRDRASKAGKSGGRHHPKISSGAAVSPKLKSERVRPKLSKRARVSEHKVRQADKVRKRRPDLADQVAAGEISLADATRALKPDVRANKLDAAVWPDGRYGVVLADPPWKPDDGLLDPTRQIENQYPTLTLDALCALRPRIDALALDDCVLLLWTPAPKVADAVALIAAWGFTVKSGAVWIKDSIGMGYWFRSRHELLIVATRGRPMTPLDADRPDSVITAPRRGHSEKPDAVYALVERMFPRIPKVELFARAARDGWAHATNETELRTTA